MTRSWRGDMARFNRLLLLGLCLALAASVMAEDAKPAADAAAAAAPAEAAKPAEATAEAAKAGSDSATAGAAPADASAAPADPKAAKAAKMEEDRKRFAKMTPEERAAEREAKKKERCLLLPRRFFPCKRHVKGFSSS